MTIEHKQEGEAVLLALEGKLDTLTAPELSAAIDKEIDGTGALVLDFEKLTYISSAGLRTLLSAQKRMAEKKGSLRILHSNEMVLSVFSMTGFDKILTLE